MRSLLLLLLLVPLAVPLGELPEDSSDDVPSLTSSEDSEDSEDITEDVGPTPPSFASPLDPLPSMSVPLARPPGFRPPTTFKQQKGESEAVDNVNVGFVVRRGRAKVMGFSRRKTDDS